MDAKNFVISEQLANSIFGYLSTKPYREVAPLIAGLGELQLVDGEAVQKQNAASSNSPASGKVE